MLRVEGRGSRVEGNIFFVSELFFQMSQIVGVVNRRLVNPIHYIEVCLLCH